MASEKQTLRIYVDADEFTDTLAFVMKRRNFASPAVRMAIDRVLNPIDDGEASPDVLRITWQGKWNGDTSVVHIVPSQTLLDLAVPLSEIQGLLRKL